MSYPTHANQNTYYAIYPRSTQAYNYARTSTWVNQRGYITLTRTSIYHVRTKILIMLYIPKALRHTTMPGLQRNDFNPDNEQVDLLKK